MITTVIYESNDTKRPNTKNSTFPELQSRESYIFAQDNL